MKNLSPRRREMINLLNEKLDISATELQLAFNISQATVYREMQVLIDSGYAHKIPGGISQREPSSHNHCAQCHQPTHARTAFVMEQLDGVSLAACCAHCGLMAIQRRPGMRSVMTADFFYGTMLNAAQAWYVLESGISPCCRPSVLSFASRENAERFAEAFGGHAADFSQARQETQALMAFSV